MKRKRVRPVAFRGASNAEETAPTNGVPSNNQDATLDVILSDASATVIDALVDEPEAWGRSGTGAYIYGPEGGTHVLIGDPKAAPIAAEEAVNKILELGDARAQQFIFIMARCLASSNPFEMQRFHVNDSLAFRGLKRKKRDFRSEQKIEEARGYRALEDIYVSVRSYVDQPGSKRKKPVKVTSRLINFATESEEIGSPADSLALENADPQLSLGPFEARANEVPYAFRMALGEWARDYVANRPAYVAPVLKQIATYDVSSERTRLAMRIGLAIMFKRLGTAHTVREFLSLARIEIPKLHPERLKEDLEEALEILTRDRILKEWSYFNEITLPATRWREKWLDFGLRIVPLRGIGDRVLSS
jgi:hypothetical protein